MAIAYSDAAIKEALKQIKDFSRENLFKFKLPKMEAAKSGAESFTIEYEVPLPPTAFEWFDVTITEGKVVKEVEPPRSYVEYPEIYRVRTDTVRPELVALAGRYLSRIGLDLSKVDAEYFHGGRYSGTLVGEWVGGSNMIRLRYDIAPALFLFALMHEGVHATQVTVEKRLDTYWPGTWDGERRDFKLMYHELPWEIDANDRAMRLVTAMAADGELPDYVRLADVEEIHADITGGRGIKGKWYEVDPHPRTVQPINVGRYKRSGASKTYDEIAQEITIKELEKTREYAYAEAVAIQTAPPEAYSRWVRPKKEALDWRSVASSIKKVAKG
jgi:hypothetical protein